MGTTGWPFASAPRHQSHKAKRLQKKKSRMKLIIDSKRQGWLSIFLPVMSKIIDSKQSGPNIGSVKVLFWKDCYDYWDNICSICITYQLSWICRHPIYLVFRTEESKLRPAL